MNVDQLLLSFDNPNPQPNQTRAKPSNDEPGHKPRRRIQAKPPWNHPSRIRIALNDIERDPGEIHDVKPRLRELLEKDYIEVVTEAIAMDAIDPRTVALNRKLYLIRISQAALAVTCVVLTLYSYINPGWWFNLATPTIIAVCVGLPSFLTATFSILRLERFQPVTRKLRLLLEAGFLGLWIIAFAFMTLDKGKNYRSSFATPPYLEWGFAVACSMVQIVAYGLSAWLVWKGAR